MIGQCDLLYCYNARALRHARAFSSYNAPDLRHHEEPARKLRCTSRFFVRCFAVVGRLHVKLPDIFRFMEDVITRQRFSFFIVVNLDTIFRIQLLKK